MSARHGAGPEPAVDGALAVIAVQDAVLRLRRNPSTEAMDLVLCLLETARHMLPAAVAGEELTDEDVAGVRSCARAAELAARRHLWRRGGTAAVPAPAGA